MEFLDETLQFPPCHSAPKRVDIAGVARKGLSGRRKRIRPTRILPLIVASCAVLAASAALYMDAPRQQARAEILWTRPICVETNRYIGWPSVCRLKNGDLLAVFSGDRAAHICPFGKVQMVRSTDDGETWSAPQTLANGPIDDRDAGIVQMPDGEIVVTWFTSVAYRSIVDKDWPETDYRHWWKQIGKAHV